MQKEFTNVLFKGGRATMEAAESPSDVTCELPAM
jgi:hypothetical protein